MYFSCQERETKEKTKTIDHQLQFNHHKLTHATPCKKKHDCASMKTADCQKLAIEWCQTCHLNGMDVTNSLARMKHTPTTFQFRN